MSNICSNFVLVNSYKIWRTRKVLIDDSEFSSLTALTSMWKLKLLFACSMHSLTVSRWINLDLFAALLQRQVPLVMTRAICSSSTYTVTSIRCVPRVSLPVSASATLR